MMIKNTHLISEKNMAIILSVLFLILLSNASFSQFSVKILNEGFNNNAMRWDIKKDSAIEMEINEGKYHLGNKADGTALTSTIDVPHIQTHNFKISATFSKLNGIENNGFGLIWGSLDMNNEYEFVISSNGFFKVLKWQDGKKTDIIDWTYQSSINKWDFAINKLKLECMENILRFYINDTYVFATKYMAPFGQKTGIILNETMDIDVDDFVVENLSGNFTNKIDTALQSVQLNKLTIIGNPEKIFKSSETSQIEMELTNTGNELANDLIIYVSIAEEPNALIYNQYTLIDEIKPGENKQLGLPFEVSETSTEKDLTVILNLKNTDNQIIDTDTIIIHIKAPETGIIANEEISNNNQDNTNQGLNADSEFKNCTTGCISSGIATIITAILIAVFE